MLRLEKMENPDLMSVSKALALAQVWLNRRAGEIQLHGLFLNTKPTRQHTAMLPHTFPHLSS
jgi:hypothetical protein